MYNANSGCWQWARWTVVAKQPLATIPQCTARFPPPCQPTALVTAQIPDPPRSLIPEPKIHVLITTLGLLV